MRGRGDQPARFFIERRHQFALGQLDHVGAVDDVVGMAHQRGAGAGQLRVLMRELEQVVDDGAAFGAVVAAQDFSGARMQLFDRRQPRQPERFAPDHDRQRQRCGGSECQRDIAQRFAAREQVLDQIDDAAPETEQQQPADGGPEQRAPAKAAADRDTRRIDRHRQGRRIGLGRDVHGAAGGTPGFIRTHHDHAGIVELERGRPPMRRFLAHCSRSPIRNWSARSRRM